MAWTYEGLQNVYNDPVPKVEEESFIEFLTEYKLLDYNAPDKGPSKINMENICNLRTLHDLGQHAQTVAKTSKALSIFRKNGGFTNSEDEVSLEKVLLLAGIKKSLAEAKLQGVFPEEKSTALKVYVNDIAFPLRVPYVEGQDPQKELWFVCVLTSNDEMQSSDPVKLKPGMYIEFQNTFEFKDLQENFEIILRLYALSIRNMLSRAYFAKDRRRQPRRLLISDFKASAFEKWAEVRLKAGNLQRFGNGITFSLTTSHRRLRNIMHVQFFDVVNSKIFFMGHLNLAVATGSALVWVRKWCVLQGTSLFYYNDSSDAMIRNGPNSRDERLDLATCINRRVNRMDRILCAKANTLALEFSIVGHPAYATRVYVQAESEMEIQLWEEKLNDVIISVRKWKAMFRQINANRQN